MAIIYAAPIEPLAAGISGPIKLGDASLRGGKTHAQVKILDLAAQAAIQPGDRIDWGGLPKGAVPVGAYFNPSVSLGASTIDVGMLVGASFTAAKFRTAGVLTSIDTTNWYLRAVAVGVPLAAACRIQSLVATAALPAGGIVASIFLYTTPHGG